MKLRSLVCLWVFSLSLFATGFTDSFSSSSLTFSKNSLGYDVIQYEGLSNSANIGAPSLPIKTQTFIIPADCDVSSLSIVADTLQIKGEFKIVPAQQAYPEGEEKITQPDSIIYMSNALYPSVYASVAHSGFIDGANHIVTIVYSPLRYHPASQKLVLVSSISVVFNYKSACNKPIYPDFHFAQDAAKYDVLLNSLVSNPEELPSYRNIPNIFPDDHYSPDDYNYVIICPADFANRFTDFVEWKQSKGLYVHVETLENIRAQYPAGDIIHAAHPVNDLAGSVRQYIYNQWLHHGLTHVLLVGDGTILMRCALDFSSATDTDINADNIPYRMQIPSDLYFADVNGDWNSNDDLYIGVISNSAQADNNPEYQYYPDDVEIEQDVFVGRVCVPSALEGGAAQINNWIEKLLVYEKDPGKGDRSYLTNAYVHRADLEMCGDGYPDCLRALGFDVLQSVEDGANLEPSGWTFIHNMQFNDDYKGIVSLFCHGKKYRIAITTDGDGAGNCPRRYICSTATTPDEYNGTGYYVPPENGNSFEDLVDTSKYCVFLAESCDTGAFDRNLPGEDNDFNTQPCLGEAYTTMFSKRGGPLYIGFSRASYANNFRQCFTNTLDNSSSLYPGYLKSDVGVAFAVARQQMSVEVQLPYPDPDYSNIVNATEFTCFGDPDMNVWLSQPQTLQVNCNTAANGVTVTDDTGVPVPSARVIFQSGTQRQIISTNSSGIALSSLTFTQVTALKDGYCPSTNRVIRNTEIISSTGNATAYTKTNILVPASSHLILDGHVALTNRSQIIVDGTLEVTGGSLVEGSTASYQTAAGETAYGDRIVIRGVLSTWDSAQFGSDNSVWDGLLFENENLLTIDHTNFINTSLIGECAPIALDTCALTNCNLTFTHGTLSIDACTTVDVNLVTEYCHLSLTNSTFTGTNHGTSIYHGNADITISNCQLDGCEKEASYISLYMTSTLTAAQATLSNSTITGFGESATSAILITSYPNVNIVSNHLFENSATHCLDISESGHGGQVTLRNNIIENNAYENPNSGNGVFLYHSNAGILGANVIRNNFNGVVAMNASSWQALGYSSEVSFQHVIDNNSREFIFQNNSIPDRINYNFIYHSGTNSLVFCNGGNDGSIDVQRNYWGIEGLTPSTDLIPTAAYDWDPVWVPGDITEVHEDEVYQLFQTASEDEENEQYELAACEYKDVIRLFPKSKYVTLAEKALLRVEEKLEKGRSNNLLELKEYLDSTNVLHDSPEMDFFTNSIANNCDIQMGNFTEALNWLDSVLSNPPTIEDSITAAIDYGYVCMLMQAGGRGQYSGNRRELCPRNYSDWLIKRGHFLERLNLLGDAEDGENICPSKLVAVNYPNPFNPTTTIAYSLPKEGKVTLSVYNLRGQLVKQLVNENQTTGKHQVLWNGTNSNGQTVATGVYFYRLETNHNVITKKMLLMK